jgi:HEPN domain-containing protein
MRALTKEWMDKADDDFYSAEILLHSNEHPLPGNACFHAQQSAEKYLKAFLVENEIDFPRTHQLMVLLELCAGVDVSFLEISSGLRRLEGYAVAVRYPGIVIDSGSAEKALQTVGTIRGFVQQKLL